MQYTQTTTFRPGDIHDACRAAAEASGVQFRGAVEMSITIDGEPLPEHKTFSVVLTSLRAIQPEDSASTTDGA